MKHSQQYDVLLQTESMYASLLEVFPDDVRFLRRYGETLWKLEKRTKALQCLRRLHSILLNTGEVEQARTLEEQYPLMVEKEASDSVPDHFSTFLDFAQESLLDQLVTKLKYCSLGKGDYLFRQGDHGDSMYVLLGGELSVFASESGDEEPFFLSLLRCGDVVGEMAFFSRNPRSADVMANQTCQLLELSRSHVESLFQSHPELEKSLEKEVDVRCRMRHFSGNDILRRLPYELRRRIAEKSSWLHVPSTQVLDDEGVPSVSVLTKGSVRIEVADQHHDTHIIDYYHVDDLVADMMMEKNDEHRLKLITADDCEMVMISLDEFTEIVQDYAPLSSFLKEIGEAHMEKSSQLFPDKT
ncbi:MAG: cyclic nucleotide-binding domain-containing protein [Mariprofundaceae bacterium]|nr:cyclic nucleotide-binding domain-containing protein [Mariprofundaceae bacterium]